MTSVTFEQYSAYSYVLRGQLSAQEQEDAETRFEATFNDRLRGGAGWIIRNRHCSDVTAWIASSESLILDGPADNQVTVASLLASVTSIEGQLHTLKSQLSQLGALQSAHATVSGAQPSTSQKSTSRAEAPSQIRHPLSKTQDAGSAPRLLGGR